MQNSKVILVDAGTGNLRSVGKALEALGASVTLTSDPHDLAGPERIVLPGVGAFAAFMSGLKGHGLDEAVCQAVQRGTPVLGICVGMQAFFDVDEEMGQHPGLGLLRGRVVRFELSPELKVPHNGWNQLWPVCPSPLTENIAPGAYAVFNHSYYCAPDNPADVILTSDFGILFAAAVQRGNLFGVQFHPEKSQRVGLELLQNFLKVQP